MPTLETAKAWYPSDPIHGFDHIERVYRWAELLARAENADIEIVRAAALLHDATPVNLPARKARRASHHQDSADLAREVLTAEGWSNERIAAVEHCIRAHRFRDSSQPPQTLEAKILFDAETLDAIGAIGVARAIAYSISHGSPVYAEPSATFLQTGVIQPGEPHSAYHEYIFKLRHLAGRLYTSTARAAAAERHQAMAAFFDLLKAEMTESPHVEQST